MDLEARGQVHTEITCERADASLHEIAGREWKNSNESQHLRTRKRLCKWQTGLAMESYESRRSRSTPPRKSTSHRIISRSKSGPVSGKRLWCRRSLRNLTPNEYSRWKSYTVQRLENPRESVSKPDWDRMNSWKILSRGNGSGCGVTPRRCQTGCGLVRPQAMRGITGRAEYRECSPCDENLGPRDRELDSKPQRPTLSAGELYVSFRADFNDGVDELQECVSGFFIVSGRVEMVVNHAPVLRYVPGESA